MKQIFVLNDIAMATNKALGALAQGELGAYGYDSSGTWVPVAEDTSSEVIQFGIGSGNASPLMTMPIIDKVKSAKLTKAAWVAEVLPAVTVVASVSGYTAHVIDSLTLNLTSEEHFNQNNRKKESFLIPIVASMTATQLHAAIAAEVNLKSENFTATANGATNVVITAKATGLISLTTDFERYSSAAATTAPTFGLTYTTAVEGVGTKAKVTELVDKLYQRFGIGETMNRYEKTSLIQPVTGTKYTLLTFTFIEDKPTSPTVDTHFVENEIIFACDVTAGSPTTLVADLEDFIKYVFLGVPIPVVV